jgi:acetyltransferase-like isoleucine patch superfamily enzyme
MNHSAGNLPMQFFRLVGRMRNRFFTLAVRGSFRLFGKDSTLQTPAGIWGAYAISIGKCVHVGAGSWLQFLGDEAGGIEIGDGCSFAGGVTITAVRSVRIGDHVLIGRNVHISDHGHEYRMPGKPILAQGVSEVAPVVIGSGSWLGQGVVICPGVTIGENCVIGANSVVKSDVPARSVAVGAPARVVRRLDP